MASDDSSDDKGGEMMGCTKHLTFKSYLALSMQF